MDTRTGEVREFAPTYKIPEHFVPINDIFEKGSDVEIEGTKWRVVNSFIKPGTPGRVTLVLSGLPGTTIAKQSKS